jgi:hypothetical protein
MTRAISRDLLIGECAPHARRPRLGSAKKAGFSSDEASREIGKTHGGFALSKISPLAWVSRLSPTSSRAGSRGDLAGPRDRRVLESAILASVNFLSDVAASDQSSKRVEDPREALECKDSATRVAVPLENSRNIAASNSASNGRSKQCSSLGCNRHLLRNGSLAAHRGPLEAPLRLECSGTRSRDEVEGASDAAASTFMLSSMSRSAFRDLLLGNDASSSLRADIKFRPLGRGLLVVYRHGA